MNIACMIEYSTSVLIECRMLGLLGYSTSEPRVVLLIC